MENNDWLQQHITYIKGLKSPTDQQAFFVLLSEKQQRTPQDEKKLAILIRAEKASIKAGKARQDAATLIRAEKNAAKEEENAKKEEARKARNHRLIQQGILFDLAGLKNRSRGEMLGLLLTAAAIDDPQKWEDWKTKGDEILARPAPENEI